MATESLGYKTFGLKQQVGEITAVGRAAGTTTLAAGTTTGTSFWAREVFGNDITVTNTNTPLDQHRLSGLCRGQYPPPALRLSPLVSDVTVTGKSVAVNTAETTTKTIAPLVSTGAAQIATLDDTTMCTTTVCCCLVLSPPMAVLVRPEQDDPKILR